MIIDYSTQSYSSSILYANVPFEYGSKHIILAFSGEIPWEVLGLAERIVHFVLGVLESIPVLGHLVALADYFLNNRVSVLYLHNPDPYERGLAQGQFFKHEILIVYALVRHMIQAQIESKGLPFFEKSINEFQQALTDPLLEEMQGISDATGVPLSEIFQAHVYIDVFAGTYGCSTVASIFEEGKASTRTATTNHYLAWELLPQGEHPQIDESRMRKQTLIQIPLEPNINSHLAALKEVSKQETIQSIVFDLQTQDLAYSASWFNAAHKTPTYANFSQGAEVPASRRHVFLAHTLDWPWIALAPYTTLVVNGSTENRNGFVNFTFPGFIGVLAGVNHKGIGLACSQCGDERDEMGRPNTLLFRHLLEETNSIDEALSELATIKSGSSMNLIIASAEKVANIELRPNLSQPDPFTGGFFRILNTI